jgi:hypothetical protein
LPKFEELDTTNMLLRQRIIFLGSQVFFFSFLFWIDVKSCVEFVSVRSLLLGFCFGTHWWIL